MGAPESGPLSETDVFINKLAQHIVEICDCLRKAFMQLRLGFPVKLLAGQRYVRPALARIVLRQRLLHGFGLRACQVDDGVGEFANGEFVGVAEVDRSRKIGSFIDHSQEALDEVVDVAEAARLLAVAVDRDRLTLQRLDDEIRHHAPVVGMHSRAIGVEDAHDLDVEFVLAVIVEEQRLGAALAFVVAGARPDRVDIAPVALGLRMDRGIAVDLGGGGLQDACLHPLGKAEHVDRSRDAGLGRLHRIKLVVNRARWTSEIVDLVDLDIQRKADVMAHKFEARMAGQVIDIALVAGKQVVDAKNLIAAFEQPVDEVRADEARASGDQDALPAKILTAHELTFKRDGESAIV